MSQDSKKIKQKISSTVQKSTETGKKILDETLSKINPELQKKVNEMLTNSSSKLQDLNKIAAQILNKATEVQAHLKTEKLKETTDVIKGKVLQKTFEVSIKTKEAADKTTKKLKKAVSRKKTKKS